MVVSIVTLIAAASFPLDISFNVIFLKTLLGGTSVIYGGLNDGTPIQLYPSSGVPSGVICIWSGNQNNIPTGWALCDGNNGTPNLTNRFILGYGTKSCGATGGTETVSLTTANMPSHSHNATLNLSGLSTSNDGEHTHTISMSMMRCDYAHNMERVLEAKNGYDTTIVTNSGGGAHSHTITGSGSVAIDNTGSGTAHDNMPPYYVLCYIMKL